MSINLLFRVRLVWVVITFNVRFLQWTLFSVHLSFLESLQYLISNSTQRQVNITIEYHLVPILLASETPPSEFADRSVKWRVSAGRENDGPFNRAARGPWGPAAPLGTVVRHDLQLIISIQISLQPTSRPDSAAPDTSPRSSCCREPIPPAHHIRPQYGQDRCSVIGMGKFGHKAAPIYHPYSNLDSNVRFFHSCSLNGILPSYVP